jgi:metal-sulfur cluster biosynthetic enzyme
VVTKKKIIEALKEVVDPELGLNVIDLGLIYDIKVENEKVFVKMTLTSPFCPMSQFLVSEVENKIKEIGTKNVKVEVVFEPPWTPERMSKKAKKLLGFK